MFLLHDANPQMFGHHSYYPITHGEQDYGITPRVLMLAAADWEHQNPGRDLFTEAYHDGEIGRLARAMHNYAARYSGDWRPIPVTRIGERIRSCAIKMNQLVPNRPIPPLPPLIQVRYAPWKFGILQKILGPQPFLYFTTMGIHKVESLMADE